MLFPLHLVLLRCPTPHFPLLPPVPHVLPLSSLLSPRPILSALSFFILFPLTLPPSPLLPLLSDHVNCLRDKGMADLKELPTGKWFCRPQCAKVSSGHGQHAHCVANGNEHWQVK